MVCFVYLKTRLPREKPQALCSVDCLLFIYQGTFFTGIHANNNYENHGENYFCMPHHYIKVFKNLSFRGEKLFHMIGMDNYLLLYFI